MLFTPDAAITLDEIVELGPRQRREAVTQGRHADLRTELVEEVDHFIALLAWRTHHRPTERPRRAHPLEQVQAPMPQGPPGDLEQVGDA